MVEEAYLCGGDRWGGVSFGHENSRLDKVYDFISGYLRLERKWQTGNEVHYFA